VSEISLNYSLENDGHVSITLYDLKGRVVKILDQRDKTSGANHVTWNGTDKDGAVLPSGIYFVKIVSGNEAVTKRIMMTK
jgi:flagellar hook assembly protein FlgD